MLILGVDTSGKEGSIALARGDAGCFEVLEVVTLAGGMYSAQLIPQIAAALARHNLTKNDIEGFAVASGPGSFTGLRVGLSAIKALAEILGKPIAAVSVLEATAAMSEAGGRVVAVMDAMRGEVYAGCYDPDENKAREMLLPLGEFLTLVREETAAIVTPDATILQQLLNSGVQARRVDRPRADTIARLGLQRILAGETITPEALEANYLRRSDAEIFAKTKP